MPRMVRLALTLIARNEARCIERCLLSAQPLVDHMVVLDTGSTDDTPAIARRCGATVLQGPWTEDFSAARNHVLEAASAQWHLVLDADEWFDAATAPDALRRFTDQHPQTVGSLCVRNSFDLQGAVEHTEVWLSRLLPGEVRYQGRIHEQPQHGHPVVRLPVLVHHDGYRSAQAQGKATRNMALLHAELQARPSDPYLHYQLGTQYESAQDWPAAQRHYAQAAAAADLQARYAHDLLTRHLHALARTRQFDAALELAAHLQDLWPSSSDVFFVIGNLCLDVALERPDEALAQWIPLAEASWLRCLEIGEVGAQDHHVLGRGSYLAAHNLAVLCEGLGQAERAGAFREQAGPRVAHLGIA